VLDPHEDDLVSAWADRQSHALASRQPRGVENFGGAAHGHQLHRSHAECADGLMTNQKQVGSRALHDLTTDFVGGWPYDGAPQADSEKDNEQHEQDDDKPHLRSAEPARTSAPACSAGQVGVTVSVRGQ